MQILNDFSKLKVIVVGDVMLDRYWWGSVNRISPEAPVPIVNLKKMSYVAGGAANVAANLVGLGATPLLFGVKGDDEDGKQLDDILSDAGVREKFIPSIVGRPTTTKTRIVAHSQHVVRIDHESTASISNEMSNEIFQQISEELDDVDAVIVSDYSKGFVTDQLLNQLIIAAREKGKLIVIDPKGMDFSKYKGASVLTPNKREAADAVGLNALSDNVVPRSGNLLMDSLDLSALLITEGESGMTLFQRNSDALHLDSWAHDVYDVTGAGDTVIATFTAAAAAGYSFVDAARFANAAAGYVVGKVGTTKITSEAFADFLNASEHNHLFESLHA
jgi:D-beta-D-heptose 7-phosphate kinase/D-beta-D-heptose 1-phosphate adenosyltransferase